MSIKEQENLGSQQEIEKQNKEDKQKDLKYYAKVHSYETFGTVDGPGIRFVIFLQGCHLKCKYCHNRDTWDINGGEYKTIEEVIEKILKYKTYIKASNGGITVTGGEPLLQVKFVKELFRKLKQLGFHTCIDTSGMVEITEDVREVLENTDLVLLDIKHIDSEKCKELTGHPNKNELEFARYLSEKGKKMWIRQVIVPGITDDEHDIMKLREFIDTLETVEKVEFLPYHSMGRYKWTKLGANYELEDIRYATTEDIKRVKNIYERGTEL